LPFFQWQTGYKPADIEKLKADYCKTNNLHCARYIIAQSLGKEHMPPDLYPHEKERAFELLAK